MAKTYKVKGAAGATVRTVTYSDTYNDAKAVEVDTTNLAGFLSSSDDTLQEVIDNYDDHVHSVTTLETTTARTLALTDANDTIVCTSASATEVTIPANAAVAFPVGTKIPVVQGGAGTVTITGDTGVTLNGTSGGSGDLTAQYDETTLIKIATDTWIGTNDLGAVS